MSQFLQIRVNLQLDLATMTAVQLVDIFLIGSSRTGLDPRVTLKALIWVHFHAGVAIFEVASHIPHKSVMASFSEIRGLCGHTKNKLLGTTLGITGFRFSFQWRFSWSIQLLQQWNRSFGTQPRADTNFLIPSCNKDGPIVPLQAMSYMGARGWFRQWPSIPWPKSSLCADIDPLSYSIHGMKDTLLSWGAQLGHKGIITDEMRRLQGHHKPAQSSVTPYSHDDVGSPLDFHRSLVAQVKQGWRPLRYQWKIVHLYSNTNSQFQWLRRTLIRFPWPPAQTPGLQPTHRVKGRLHWVSITIQYMRWFQLTNPSNMETNFCTFIGKLDVDWLLRIIVSPFWSWLYQWKGRQHAITENATTSLSRCSEDKN